MAFQEKDPLSEPVRSIVYARTDLGNGKYGWIAVEGVDNGNGLGTLKTSGAGGSGGSGGTGNTVAATSAGSSATTANPIQGVTGGVAVPVSGTFFPATQPVSLNTLPALAAGSAAIGTVGVTALPALAAGSNAIGTVGVTALPALPAGSNAIGTVGVTALPALPAGSNSIGSVVTPILGIGDLFFIPTTGTNTVPVLIGTKPAGARGIVLYFTSGQSAAVNYSDTQSNSQTGFVALKFFPFSYNVASVINEYVGAGQNVYVGAVAGTPLARWI